jgi:exopolysaccharide biosynthesis polyprenyl glycosylphosphotransferase
MFRKFTVNFALFSMGLDFILASLSLLISTQLRPSLSYLPSVKYIPGPIHLPPTLYIALPFIWILILLTVSIYDGRKNLRLIDEITSLTYGSIIAVICQAGILYLSYRELSRFLFLFFVSLASFSMFFWRICFRISLKIDKNDRKNQRKVLIIGAGVVGRQLQEQININSLLSLSVVGFLDDDPEKIAHHPDIIGNVKDAHQIVSQLQVDDVVVALPSRAHEEVNRLVANLHNLPVKIWIIPDYFHLALHKAVVEEFAGIPMFDLRAPALNDYQRMVKRAFDLGLITITSPILLVILGIIALKIKIENPGKILLHQERVGENGRLFEMLKFRTMIPGAENLRHLVEHFDEKGNFIHKSADDPRVTKIGHFLRKTSLDELPQIINVLRGEMSLVGPRPELPYLVDNYQPWQRKRFAVPQGITGWWQVNGRSDKPMHLHTEDDLFYVHNYSLLLDIQILIRTIWIVFIRKGAY